MADRAKFCQKFRLMSCSKKWSSDLEGGKINFVSDARNVRAAIV
jgi:hypothetical protein